MINKKLILIILLALMIIAVLIIYLSQNLHRVFVKEVKHGFELDSPAEVSILGQEDIIHLPKPVQKYLLYTGAVGKEKVHNIKVVADGEIKLNEKWCKVNIDQYNFLGSHLSRLFYLNVKGYVLPIYGLHSYTDKQASMLVKFGGLIPAVNAKGEEMRISDTITLLNDMCIFAPASLVDSRIQWEPIDDRTVKAIFKTKYCTVSANLYFNEKGELVNFSSQDRYCLEEDGSCKKVKWSTPLKNYRYINGLLLASCVEAVWNYPQGDDCYIKVTNIKELKYNCDSF